MSYPTISGTCRVCNKTFSVYDSQTNDPPGICRDCVSKTIKGLEHKLIAAGALTDPVEKELFAWIIDMANDHYV